MVTVAAGSFVLLVLGERIAPARGQGQSTGFAAVPSEKGGQDVFGGYDVAAWPKPLTITARP